VAGKHIVILGPPGSGKGTQAVRIAEKLDLRHISTGDVLRDAVNRETKLGLEASDYMNRGLLVPDELMLGLIAEKLAEIGDSGWILDGYPRTLPQAEALGGMLAEQDMRIDHVLLIDVDSEVIVKRLSERRVCSKCKAVYSLSTLESPDEACRKCGGELVKRPDDEEDTVRRRLKVYEEQTAPVVDYYRNGGLVTVKGAGGIDKITAEILRVLQ